MTPYDTEEVIARLPWVRRMLIWILLLALGALLGSAKKKKKAKDKDKK